MEVNQQLNLGRAAGSVSQHVVGGCIMPARFDKWQENEMFHLVYIKDQCSTVWNLLEKELSLLITRFFLLLKKHKQNEPSPPLVFFSTELHPFSTSTQRKNIKTKGTTFQLKVRAFYGIYCLYNVLLRDIK